MDEFADWSEAMKAYQFTSPESNVKLSFGDNTTSYFLYHAENVPNRFQRWMLLKVFGVKLEKIQ
jgi:hypothetical protein